MPEAVIVSTARTPIGRAYRGAFNDTQGQTLAGHVVAEAVRRAGIDPAEVEDVVLGAALQQGSTGYNVARQAALRAGLPVSVPGMNTYCCVITSNLVIGPQLPPNHGLPSGSTLIAPL